MSKHLFFATLRGMAKEGFTSKNSRPTSRLLARRGGLVTPWRTCLPRRLVRRSSSEGGFGDDLKWLRDLTEDKPESRDLTPMPQNATLMSG